MCVVVFSIKIQKMVLGEAKGACALWVELPLGIWGRSPQKIDY